MALEATHIRFALDLKEKYRIHDIKKYVVGTIYPDSKYITGMDKILTHPIDYMNWHWETANDFKKGWLVHLLADKIHWSVTKEYLPHIFEDEIEKSREAWIRHTAIKILQDLDDVRKFDIKQYLPYLKFTENPNGEDLKKIRQYNQLFPKMYADPTKLSIDSYYKMWKEFGVGDELALSVKTQAEQYSKDAVVMAAVHEMYQKMLDGMSTHINS